MSNGQGRGQFGLCCAGSSISIGPMLMLVALGLMSVAWMSLIAIAVQAQKLLPPKPPSTSRSRSSASGS